MKFELGHNEIDDAEDAEFRIADDLVSLFTDLGLDAPKPVPVIRAEHQVAQKLHAVSGEGNERARDLVDLQLLDKREDLDLVQVRMTCVRLFEYRRQQHWPPTVAVGDGWDTLYEAAVEDVDVLPDVERRSLGSTHSSNASRRPGLTARVAEMWQDDQSRPDVVNARQRVCAGQPNNANDDQHLPLSVPRFQWSY